MFKFIIIYIYTLMKKIYYYMIAFSFIALFNSCSNKIGELTSEYFDVTPDVLELKAGKVDAVITAKFPAEYFNKKSTLTMTPVLVSASGEELIGTPVTYQGEKVKGNSQVIPYKEGATVTQSASFVYDEKFKIAELYLDFAVKAGKKEFKLPRVKIADGIITTATLVTAENLSPIFALDKFQKSIKQSYEAQIKFLIEQANIRNSELKSGELATLLSKLNDSKDSSKTKLEGIEVLSYASPDGSMELNTKLAEKRQIATENYLNKIIQKGKINANVNAKFTAEDWDGFQQLVQASNIEDKNLILSVLSNYTDPEQREIEIKKMSSVYSKLADEILPELRRSRMILTLDVLGKSDQQILDSIKSNIKSLTADEALYGATLVASNEEKAKIYQAVIENFPGDYRGYNNLGAIKFIEKNYTEAKSLFEKAFGILDIAETNFNLGLVALVEKDFGKAASYLAKANGVGESQIKEAYGVMQIAQGLYPEAATSLNNSKTNAGVLSQILVLDYNKATEVLKSIEKPDALTHYLKAIVGARTSDKDMTISSLKSAVSMNKEMAKMAIKDIEFAKFFTDEAFLAIVK